MEGTRFDKIVEKKLFFGIFFLSSSTDLNHIFTHFVFLQERQASYVDQSSIKFFLHNKYG